MIDKIKEITKDKILNRLLDTTVLYKSDGTGIILSDLMNMIDIYTLDSIINNKKSVEELAIELDKRIAETNNKIKHLNEEE
tara:strand:+ start:238 stop:480 length:243 start_codon:yes stop_codon:yes gene_type:complete